MKAIKLFSMAVAALILGACSNEDNDVQQPAQQARMIPFEATIGPASSANTRTVVKEGTGDYAGKLTVEWKGNEEIALVHNGTWDKVTVTKVNEDGSAVVSGSITELGAEGEDAKLVYPYGAVASVEAGTANYEANTSNDFLAPGFAQDGTLDYISDNALDGRVGTGILKTVGGITTIKKSATVDNVVMESKTAIWKLTLQDNASNAINAKTVTLKLGGVPIAGGSYASGMSSYYICVVPATLTKIYDAAATLLQPTPAFTIEAYDGTNTYTYTKTSKLTLANSAYYQSTVTMLPYPIALSAVTNAYVGSVVTSDGKVYATVADATTASKTAVAMIAYVSSTGHGLAIQLNASPSEMNWNDAKTYASSLTAVPGGSWRLPTKADWQNMFVGCAKDGDDSDASDNALSPIAGFKEKITATGTTWQSSKFYWSSTKVSESSTNAWDVSVNLVDSPTSATFYEGNTTSLNHYVLDCLAF